LGGAVVFQFGNTKAHDDVHEKDGEYPATTSTIAIVPHPNRSPIEIAYDVDPNGKIQSSITTFDNEADSYGKRITLFCFGGILLLGKPTGGVAAGWTFFQKRVEVSNLYLKPFLLEKTAKRIT
jgi:hypothetical protein